MLNCLLAVYLVSATPSGARDLTVPLLEPLGAVIIDPGHGGRDPGAVVLQHQQQVMEKDINLSVAHKLKDLLDVHAPEIDVYLTREDDTYQSLPARVQMAAQVLPPEGTSKVYLSIHTNAAVVPEASGFEVWINRGDVTAYIAPTVEDAYLKRRIEEIDRTLHRELKDGTDALADAMIESLRDQVGEYMPSRGIRHQDFYVIRYSQMPSVLVEMGFMTNPSELEQLLDESFQMLIARGMLSALLEYRSR